MIVDGIYLAPQEVALLAREMWSFAPKANPRCALVLAERVAGATLAEAGAMVGVSATRASQMQAMALRVISECDPGAASIREEEFSARERRRSAREAKHAAAWMAERDREHEARKERERLEAAERATVRPRTRAEAAADTIWWARARLKMFRLKYDATRDPAYKREIDRLEACIAATRSKKL